MYAGPGHCAINKHGMCASMACVRRSASQEVHVHAITIVIESVDSISRDGPGVTYT